MSSLVSTSLIAPITGNAEMHTRVSDLHTAAKYTTTGCRTSGGRFRVSFSWDFRGFWGAVGGFWFVSARIGWWEFGPAARLGGARDPANMQWLTVEQHRAKTAGEQR